MASNRQSAQKQEIRTYAELQTYVHAALREQHPDWIETNGDCSAYNIYEKRFAELLALFDEKSVDYSSVPRRSPLTVLPPKHGR
jgi:hypothetical protein